MTNIALFYFIDGTCAAGVWPSDMDTSSSLRIGGTGVAGAGDGSHYSPDSLNSPHLMEWPLLTRDASRYRSYFPTVRLLAPDV